MTFSKLGITATYVVALLFGEQSQSHAGLYQYSWSGHLVPEGTDDPWQIGQLGQGFHLEFTIASDAQDSNSLVNYADFSVANVSLTLSGDATSYVGNGSAQFIDNGVGPYDFIWFEGDFNRLGQTLTIGAVPALPAATFQFAQSAELPPAFVPTADATQSTCCGETYASIMSPGDIVTVVPEPAGESFLLLTTFALLAVRRRCYKCSTTW